LRAVRFAAQLGFEIESATWRAVQTHAATIQTVSAERVREELLKLFRPPHAARGLDLLHASTLLAQVLPELLATVTCEQSPDFHPEGTVFRHIRLMLDQLPADAHESLPWAVLMHDIAKPQTRSCDADGGIHFYGHEKLGAQMAAEMLERLRFSRKQTDEIVAAVLWHMQFKDARQMRKSTLRQMLLRPTFDLELQLHRLDCLGSHRRLETHEFLLAQQEEIKRQPEIRQPLLRGEDLMALGVQPGPGMGQLLERIREKQLQGELSSADEARRWVKTQQL
jgi:poly(A) polymerase